MVVEGKWLRLASRRKGNYYYSWRHAAKCPSATRARTIITDGADAGCISCSTSRFAHGASGVVSSVQQQLFTILNRIMVIV